MSDHGSHSAHIPTPLSLMLLYSLKRAQERRSGSSPHSSIISVPSILDILLSAAYGQAIVSLILKEIKKTSLDLDSHLLFGPIWISSLVTIFSTH